LRTIVASLFLAALTPGAIAGHLPAIATGVPSDVSQTKMYKFKRSIRLDEYSGATIDILVDETDRLSVRAVDLIGDAWHQSLEAVARAEECHRQGRRHDANRELQTAITKLATHLDGVVSGMCECLKRRLPDFRPPEYGKRRDCTLRQKIDYFNEYVKAKRGVSPPPLNSTFKVLRDLLIHPYATKSVIADSGERVPIGQGEVFDLTTDDVRTAISGVDAWLGTITSLFEYPRGYDTLRLVQEFTPRLIRRYRDAGGVAPADDEIEFNAYRI